jgi:putative transposase
MMRADGYQVSTWTVQQALCPRGLLLPLRERVFRDPPRQHNRVWQIDLTEFETTVGGILRVYVVIDYATKCCQAATVTPTARVAEALTCLREGVAEGKRLTGPDDLRDDRGVWT